MRPVPSALVVGPFADRLLALDLPELPTDRRDEVVEFVARRVDGLPSLMHLGVMVLGLAFRLGLAVAGDPFVRTMGRLSLPLAGEYVRMVRSLGYAYVWETWPDTGATGGPAAAGPTEAPEGPDDRATGAAA